MLSIKRDPSSQVLRPPHLEHGTAGYVDVKEERETSIDDVKAALGAEHYHDKFGRGGSIIFAALTKKIPLNKDIPFEGLNFYINAELGQFLLNHFSIEANQHSNVGDQNEPFFLINGGVVHVELPDNVTLHRCSAIGNVNVDDKDMLGHQKLEMKFSRGDMIAGENSIVHTISENAKGVAKPGGILKVINGSTGYADGKNALCLVYSGGQGCAYNGGNVVGVEDYSFVDAFGESSTAVALAGGSTGRAFDGASVIRNSFHAKLQKDDKSTASDSVMLCSEPEFFQHLSRQEKNKIDLAKAQCKAYMQELKLLAYCGDKCAAFRYGKMCFDPPYVEYQWDKYNGRYSIHYLAEQDKNEAQKYLLMADTEDAMALLEKIVLKKNSTCIIS